MLEKIKDMIIVISFFFILILVLIANLLKSDTEISILERRKLAQFPEVTVDSVLEGEATKEFDKYVSDQFIGRDKFRQIKYFFNMSVFNVQDDNKMFTKNKSIYKMEYPLNEVSVEKSAKKIKNIYDKHLEGMNVYFSVIPDKTYYLYDNHLKIDYSKLEEIMKNNLDGIKYINIKDTLSAKSFYNTDLHWKQEELLNTVNCLKRNMNLEIKNVEYLTKEAGKFNRCILWSSGRKN